MLDRYRFWGKNKPERHEDFFNVVVPRANADATTATIRMYGPIDSWGGIWGVSAEEVSAALDSLPDTVKNIQLRVNSPGGEGFEGMAILNMLRAHPARVTAVVDGMAASAASFIAAGCDETIMSPGTQMMIHDAWGLCIGNAGDMEKTKSFLNSISDSIADLYVDAAGGYRAKWRSLMTEETWFTAKEAVAAGLANSVAVVPDAGMAVTVGDSGEPDAEPGETSDEPLDKFDLTVFKYAGRDQAPEPDVKALHEQTETDETSDVDPDAEDVSDADQTASADQDAADEAASESADQHASDDLTTQALASLSENAAQFAFGG